MTRVEEDVTKEWCREGRAFHVLCQEGRVDKVNDYLEHLDQSSLLTALESRESFFGHSPLHVAVINGHFAVLQLLLDKGANPNCQSNDGSTPLHLAALTCRMGCVKNLVRSRKADVFLKDKSGRTAREVAGLETIRTYITSEEIIIAAEKNMEVKDLLENDTSQLEPNCLNCALIAAVRNGHHTNACLLISKGASDFNGAFQLVLNETKNAEMYAYLLLLEAAVTNNNETVAKLYSTCKDGTGISTLVLSSELVAEGKISTHLPIEIARRMRHTAVMEELLFRTGVSHDTVNWTGLQILELESNILAKLEDMRYLYLGGNGFRTLPSAKNFQQVRKLHLQQNELTTIPPDIFKLEHLRELVLSRNKLTSLPELKSWSPSLLLLDLSHNKLSTIPGNVIKARIYSLNLSSNELKNVPLCVCNFVTLHSLDLSDNKELLSLPPQMGQLRNLASLNLSGLTALSDPLKEVTQDAKECISYLSNKLYCLKPLHHMKLVLLGMRHCGKTTLAERLQSKECGNESTVGLDISEWEYKPSIMKKAFKFSMWDFVGSERYCAIPQCCLTEGSMYLIIFNVRSGKFALEYIQFWLMFLAMNMPGACVNIVGTHLDNVPVEQREQLDGLLNEISELVSEFSEKLQIMEICAVSLKNEMENLNALKDIIYKSAANIKLGDSFVMGQMVPSSYHTLNKCFYDHQKVTHSPIMDRKGYKSFVDNLGLSDIQTDDDLDRVTQFLTHVGTILHYNDSSHNLDNLYFVDPSRLCRMIFSVMTADNTCISPSIVGIQHLCHIFQENNFPLRYFDQYLTLLDRFEIALLLDNRKVLVPSMLPNEKHNVLEVKEINNKAPYTRYIKFNNPTHPPGFWSRLISRVMYSIPKVQQIIDIRTTSLMSDDFKGCVSCKVNDYVFKSFILPSNTCYSCNQSAKPPNPSSVKLHYWKTGIYYQDTEVCFKIESSGNQFDTAGIIITATYNGFGQKIFCQSLDLIKSLLKEWYHDDRIQQMFPCPDCFKNNLHPPFCFHADWCLQAFYNNNNTTVECENQHTVLLKDVVPDLMLFDVRPELILDLPEIEYSENESSILGKGGFATVYFGRCKNQDVAIKVFAKYNFDDALYSLRKEAIILQHFMHPCVISLLGVCMRQKLALVMERAPLGSLDVVLLRDKAPIHRLVVYRILIQVIAALKALHTNGIIFRDVKASNILLWSLDPDCLCHCKISDFGVAIHEEPIGASGVEGTNGFTAPEVLGVGHSQKKVIYNHVSDIFSFGMLVYQAIARKNPFNNYSDISTVSAILRGDRPKFNGVSAYFYLSKLMQCCWDSDPRRRPNASQIIKELCLPLVQSVMFLEMLPGPSLLQHACISTNGSKVLGGEIQIMVWRDHPVELSSDINTFIVSREGKRVKQYCIKNLAECVCLCGDYVLVAPRAGFDSGTIKVYNGDNGEVIHSIPTHDSEAVCCMTCSKNHIYCGTIEGSCFSFILDTQCICSTNILHAQSISMSRIESIVEVNNSLWVSCRDNIYILNTETLEIEETVLAERRSRSVVLSSRNTTEQRITQSAEIKQMQKQIGQLKLSTDSSVVWSCLLRRSSFLSAWSVAKKTNLLLVDIKPLLLTVHQCGQDVVISAMTPALDTVWVGTTTGHILVLRNTELVMWFHPHCEYVSFLECIHSKGPCETEEAMVVSGANDLRPPMVTVLTDSESPAQQQDMNGVLIMWEAFSSKRCRQIRMIESESSTFLTSHGTVKEMISKGQFHDGTTF